jgi:hypothetical protein
VSAIWQSVDGAVAFALFLLCVVNAAVYSCPRWLRTTFTAAILVLSVLVAASAMRGWIVRPAGGCIAVGLGALIPPTAIHRERNPEMKTPDALLDDGAALLDRDGWTQYTLEDDQGRRCTLGAIYSGAVRSIGPWRCIRCRAR